jgi:molybdopterin-binding protein
MGAVDGLASPMVGYSRVGVHRRGRRVYARWDGVEPLPADTTRSSEQRGIDMKISARNQLKGRVSAVNSGEVMAEVTVRVDAGDITAAITDASRRNLDIKDGDEVIVIVKATEVMIAKD